MPNLTECVKDVLRSHDLLRGVRSVAVGFSGGADSTALLLLMRELAPGVEAVHFNHGLRDDADADEAWCRQFCLAREIPYVTYGLDVPGEQAADESVEMAARRLRLAAWERHVGDRLGQVIALGHHQDDVVETFLLRAFRGGNATGLTGLRAKRVIGGVTVIRPLLEVRKRDLVAWLGAQGVGELRHDASNDDLSIPRNAVRTRLLPVIDEIAGDFEGIARSIALLGEDAQALERMAGEVPTPLTVDALLGMDRALWSRVLRRWQYTETGSDAPVRGTVIERLKKQLAAGVPAELPIRLPFSLDRQLVINRGGVMALVQVEDEPRFEPVNWCWRECPVLPIPELGMRLRATLHRGAVLPADEGAGSWWPIDELPPELTVRQRLPGDRFIPFGANGSVRVKKVLGGAKLLFAQKRAIVVLTELDGTILWVCPVRRSAHYPITSSPCDMVHITYETDDPDDFLA